MMRCLPEQLTCECRQSPLCDPYHQHVVTGDLRIIENDKLRKLFSSRTKLYEEVEWGTLSDRRRCSRVLQIHKIYNNQTPSYLKNNLPPTSRSLINGETFVTLSAL